MVAVRRPTGAAGELLLVVWLLVSFRQDSSGPIHVVFEEEEHQISNFAKLGDKHQCSIAESLNDNIGVNAVDNLMSMLKHESKTGQNCLEYDYDMSDIRPT